MLADEIPRRYDGLWWNDDKLVIPLLVSGMTRKEQQDDTIIK
ncbi:MULTISPECIES: hypothetical protein [unclassified Wolbachia]